MDPTLTASSSSASSSIAKPRASTTFLSPTPTKSLDIATSTKATFPDIHLHSSHSQAFRSRPHLVHQSATEDEAKSKFTSETVSVPRHTDEISTTKQAFRFPDFVFPHRSHVEQSPTKRPGRIISSSDLPPGAMSSRLTGSSPVEVDVSSDVAAATPNRLSTVSQASQAASKAEAPSPTDSISPIAESLPEIGNSRGDPSLGTTALSRTTLLSSTRTAIHPALAAFGHRIPTSSIINSAIPESTSLVPLPSRLGLEGTSHFSEGQYRPSDESHPQTSERQGARLTRNGNFQVCRFFPECPLLYLRQSR